MDKKTSKKGVNKNVVSMPMVNPLAAGIDIGDKIHVVAVPEGTCTERVRTFGTMTCDLKEIAQWLRSCNIETIAMESTGVYWKPVFTLLVQEGFEVYLVNARHVKSVTGKKSDEEDAMWIQKLHSCGLLKSAYLPADKQECLRTLVRYRKTLVQDSSRFILRMQKSLELMNIKLHTVISDIVGKSGSSIVEAIIAGERDADKFLLLLDGGIKASKDAIRKSLEGNWREEHLYTLKESYMMYKFYIVRIAACDAKIEEQLISYEALFNDGEISLQPEIEQSAAPKKKLGRPKNPGPKKTGLNCNVGHYLKKIHGVDVSSIYGISELGALELLAETGTDINKWESAKHFVSWLNLCPNNKISGGKLISSQVMKKKANRASQVFRMAANSLQKSDNWLGDYFRRMKSKAGNKYAIVATANKLATIYYNMIKHKQAFKSVNVTEYQLKQKERKLEYLKKKIAQLEQTM